MKGKPYWAICAGLALLAVAAGLSSTLTFPQPGASGQQIEQLQGPRAVQLDGRTIQVSIADTPALRERGLGGRSDLAPDEGMLFIFLEDGIYPFWMKDMRFSIDILWLSTSGRIVFMAQNVSPGTYPHAFTPPRPSRYVLELPAGYAKEYNVKIGDMVGL